MKEYCVFLPHRLKREASVYDYVKGSPEHTDAFPYVPGKGLKTPDVLHE